MQCNHSSESCRADFSCCADYYVQTFGSVGEILKRVSIQMKVTMQYFPVLWFINLYIIVLCCVYSNISLATDYYVSFGSLYSLK